MPINEFISPHWTERKLRDVMRYYSRLNYLGGVSFNEYEEKNQRELFDQ